MLHRILWICVLAPMACTAFAPGLQALSSRAGGFDAPGLASSGDRWEPYPGNPTSPPPLPALGASWSTELSIELEEGEQIVTRAKRLVGVRSLARVSREVTDDCVGLVSLAYAPVGIRLMTDVAPGENGVSAIYREAKAAGALHEWPPLPGDIVFFKETYDRNKDGRRNDGMTHVGVAESIDDQGTVTFLHRAQHGVVRARFNPKYPLLRDDRLGEVLNDYLRPATSKQRGYLAGELFVAYASPEALRAMADFK